jgi:hypothetical protein
MALIQPVLHLFWMPKRMSLSVPNIALVAKQFEIEEFKRLKSRANLVGATGHMIHVLQNERGASSIYLASSGKRFEQTRQKLIHESGMVESLLREHFEAELDNSSFANAKIISLIAWILLGLDALPELRKRISDQQLSGSESIAAFSRLIAGLISLIFEVADAAIDPGISQLLVALFNLIQGKEFAGQERAVGALLFASGACSESLQQRILHLVDAQDHNFQVFVKFAEQPLAARWHAMQDTAFVAELGHLRQLLSTAAPGTKLDANLSDSWFESCTERLTVMWSIQCSLVDALQKRCDALIVDAERELMDSEGLIKALRDKPPARSEWVDRFFDPDLPVEQSLSFIPPGQVGQLQAHSVIELLQAQSRRLASMESELSSARSALNERKTIERAKGILMARFNLTEDEAYKNMRTTSMQQNRRLIEVAESVLSLTAC